MKQPPLLVLGLFLAGFALAALFLLTHERADAPTLEIPESVGVSAVPAAIHAFPLSKDQEIAIVAKPAPAEVAAHGAPDLRDPNQITRTDNPYPFPQLATETLNTAARSALVNIICTVEGVAQSVTGSGVMIDKRGIILTNAHVGQYVLLSEVATNISCTVRAGAPAKPKWQPRVMYMPPTWIAEHAPDLRLPRPTGTGEHDYALLVVEPLDAAALQPLPWLPFDTRDAIAFDGDEVLLASYPAGFLGSFTAEHNLHPATTVTTIAHLYTFSETVVDLLSLGGVIVAQGGSSGGAVVNKWGRLVGIIVTTSEGATTAERDLRAITLAHIDRSIRAHTGRALADIVEGNAQQFTDDFRMNVLPGLAKQLVDQIPK